MAKTILVVDDASMIRNLAIKTAQEAGYNIVTAKDGADGLIKLKENNIDFIFSDINMPQMGGMEMVEKIRKKSKYEFLPIVMLTTEKKEELKAQGKALGVKAWLVKPFNKKKFLMVLEKLLG
jgi:two-component system chemotaxis response regulator CheY